jgi:hypothetical protein
MFQSFKNALGLGGDSRRGPLSRLDRGAQSTSSSGAGATRARAGVQPADVEQWASLHGFKYSDRGSKGFTLEGMLKDKPWKLEQGKPSRDFIKGVELRARGEMGVNGDVSLMVMARCLKSELEKRAFSLYTDSLQTLVDPNLPEEMRWLSMYHEVGWADLGKAFLNRYTVLADDPVHARTWLTPELAGQLLAWPSTHPDVPMVLMMLRGKVYLRMQINKGDVPTLQHATEVFTMACASAVAGFRVS